MKRRARKSDLFRKPQYLVWRDGRPRWEPGPTLRAKGWKGRDLKCQAGVWLTLDAAVAAAREVNNEVAAWRTSGRARKRPPAPRDRSRTCGHLYHLWRSTPEHKTLAASTQDFYTLNAKLFLADFCDEPVAALTPPILYGYWQSLYQARGHNMANGILATVRAMLTFARKRLGWIDTNPARDLGLMKPAPRLVMWTPSQITIFIEAADQLGLPSIGDAVIAGLHTGQRQADIFALALHIFGDRIRLTQAKTRAKVDAPMTMAMRERVEIVKRRRGRDDVARMDVLILRENGAAYDRTSFGKCYRRVRKEAAKSEPAIADLKFLDLRDTAVTRLALAECTMAEIASITGHSLKTIHEIMKHYLVMNKDMADSAMRKLADWMNQEGIAL